MKASDTAGRKVIFVGGTSFSGSTLLDMMLSNDPQGFSCGEVCALFRPYRPHHINVECGCGDPMCDTWDLIRDNGEHQLYQSIFEMFPEVRIVVDSSKNPFWIHAQCARLAQQGINSRHILIWKSPAEIRMSYRKRGCEGRWLRSWINYHRLYFSLIPTYASVPYSVLAREPDSLEAVCQYLGIDYFPEKYQYWRKMHHTLFGNTAAKIHTRTMHSTEYETDMAELVSSSDAPRSLLERDFRTIYYHQPDGMETVLASISHRRQAALTETTNELKAHDVQRSGTAEVQTKARHCSLQFDPIAVFAFRMRDRTRGALLRRSHRFASPGSPADRRAQLAHLR